MADEEIDLVETALVLAALDRPDGRIDDYRRHMMALAENLGSVAHGAAGLSGKVDAIRAVIFDQHGYSGDADTCDDMLNANLMSVIDRRRGLSIALGILCIHTARSQGWDAVGVNFPSHFLVRLSWQDESAVFDSFNAAQILDEEAQYRRLQEMYGDDVDLDLSHCRQMGNRDILLSLQNNIRLNALRGGKADRALKVIETMVLLAPAQGDLRLDLAVLQARSGKLKAAIYGLEEFLELPGAAEKHGDVADFLQGLKGRLN